MTTTRERAAAKDTAKLATVTKITGDSAPKPTNRTRKPAAAKPAPKPAAKPVKSAPKPPAGPTPTVMKREVAAFAVKTLADALAKWNPKAHHGISKEFAESMIASWANYMPVAEDGWDSRLPDRSGAGGRGAKNRKSSCT